MRTGLAGLTAIFLLIAAPLYADTGEGASIHLQAGAAAAQSAESGPLVFPADSPEVKALVKLPTAQKTAVSFTWYDPSGRPYARTVKIFFPRGGEPGLAGWDSIKLKGRPPSESSGWWLVEASSSDKKLSARFLLTKNRQILTVSGGSKAQKLDALRQADIMGEGAQDTFEIAMQDRDAEVRAAAVSALKVLAGDDWRLKLLLKATADPSSDVRVVSVSQLVSYGGETAKDTSEKAASDTSTEVRKALAEALEHSKPGWAAALLGRLIKDPDADVREAALSSLSLGLSLGDGRGYFKALAEGFKTDDKSIRMGVLSVLSLKSGPDKAEAAAVALKDPDPDIRLRGLKTLSTEKDEGTTIAVRPMVGDPVEAVAAEALEFLAARGDADGLTLAVGSRYAVEKKKAFSYLVRLGPPGVHGLVVAAGDKDPDMRAEAVAVLSRLGAPEAQAVMSAALSDPRKQEREDALTYFINKGGPGLVGVLKNTACDADQAIRSTSLTRLIGISGEAASAALASSLACSDAASRETIIDALTGRPDTSATEGLKSVLNDPSADNRLKAAQTLLGRGVRGPLYRLAADPDTRVKKVALAAMGYSPGPDMLPLLLPLVRHEDEEVRYGALGLLVRIPGDEAGRAISSMLSDGSIRVRLEARDAVLSRPDEGVIDGLTELMKGNDPALRRKALAAFGRIPGRRADEVIYSSFQSGGPVLKTDALKLLSERRSALLTQAVAGALNDPDAGVRATALDIAKSISGAASEGIYTGALDSPYAEVREAGLYSFRDKSGDDAVRIFRKALNDPVPALRKEALAQLIRLKDPTLPERLPRLVLDGNAEVRGEAVRAAVDGGNVEALISAANGPYEDSAWVAVGGLLPLGDERALPVFERLYLKGNQNDAMIDGMTAVRGEAPVSALSSAYRASKGDSRLRLRLVRALYGRGVSTMPLLKDALRDGDRDVRLEAMSAMMEVDAPGKADALAVLLSDPVPDIRLAGLDALGRTPGAEAVAKIIPALKEPLLRDAALKILVSRPEPEALPDAAKTVSEIKDPAFRAGAVGMLAGKGLAAPLLIKFLDDPAFEVRYEAVKGLSASKGVEAAYALLVLADGKEGRLRAPAREALSGKSGEDLSGGALLLFERGRATEQSLKAASENIKDGGFITGLVERLPPGDAVRLRAVLGLSMGRRSPSDVPAMLAGLKADDGALKEELVQALAGVEGPEAGAALRQAYERYPALRESIFNEASGHGRAGEFVQLAAGDPNPVLRRLAARRLIGLSVPGKEALLSALLGDKDTETRLGAVDAAAEGGYEALLERASYDAFPPVASAALKSLSGLGGKVPSGFWRGVFDNPASGRDARLPAFAALSGRGEPADAGLFIRELSDADPDFSYLAGDGLVKLGKAALPGLHPLIADAKLGLRVMGVLNEIGDPSSEGPIIEALPKMDDAARKSAIEVLGKVGGEKSLSALAGLFDGSPEEIRLAILKAVAGLRLKGDEPELVVLLGKPLTSPEDAVRFQAAHAVYALKVRALKPALEARMPLERSQIVKDELARALAVI